MDRIKAQHKSGVRLLANRYMLNDCLFASTLGTLYQARDTQAGAESNKSQVLVHLLPARALGYTPLKIVCTRLQQLGQHASPNILPIIDCGWTGKEAFVVLESPQSWSLSVLPPLQAHSTNLHEKAIRLTEQLIDQGLVRKGLPAYLFLVTPDGELYLPSTVLSENLQTLQAKNESLLPPAPHNTARQRKPWLVSNGLWLVSTGIALAGGLGVYYVQNLTEKYDNRFTSSNDQLTLPPIQVLALDIGQADDKPEQITLPVTPDSPAPTTVFLPEPEPVVPPSIPDHLGQELIASIEQTRPALNRFPPELLARLSASTLASALMMDEPVQNTSTESVPEPTPVPGKNPEPTPVPEPTPADTPVPQARAQITPTPAQHPGTESTMPMPEPVSPNIARNDSVPFVPIRPHQQQPIVSHTRPVPPTPVVIQPAPRPIARPVQLTPAPPPPLTASPTTNSDSNYSDSSDSSDSPELTANGMTSAQLTQRAYAAIRQGKLDERANHGAVYFIRLLHRIDRGNPQIQRLAREVTYQHHQRARNAIAQQEFDLAERYLRMAERVIKEFNLVKLNPAQTVLEHKLAEE